MTHTSCHPVLVLPGRVSSSGLSSTPPAPSPSTNLHMQGHRPHSQSTPTNSAITRKHVKFVINYTYSTYVYTVCADISAVLIFVIFAVHSVPTNNFNPQKLMNKYKLCLCHTACLKNSSCLVVSVANKKRTPSIWVNKSTLNQDFIYFQSGFVCNVDKVVLHPYRTL